MSQYEIRDLIVKYLESSAVEFQENSNGIECICPVCGDWKMRAKFFYDDTGGGYNCFNCEYKEGLYTFFDDGVNAPEYAKKFIKIIKNNKVRSRQNSKIDKSIFEDEKPLDDKNIEVQEESRDNVSEEVEEGDFDITYTKEGLPEIPFDVMMYSYTKDGELEDFVYELVDLSEDAILYLEEERGFTQEDYIDWKFVEETQDIVVPFFSNKKENKIYGVQTRRITEKRFHNQFFKSFFDSDESCYKFYNLELILSQPKGTKVYLFESVFDGMSSGLEVWGAVIGASMAKNVKNLLTDYDIIYCNDADETGDDEALKNAKAGYKVVIHEPDFYEFKDINKLLELGSTKEENKEYILDNVTLPKKAIMMLIKKIGNRKKKGKIIKPKRDVRELRRK